LGTRPSVVVLGGGLAGMATAYTVGCAGHRDVTVLESGSAMGGLAGSFECEGRPYPLGYHHILHRDRALLWFLAEIGALDAVRWRRIRMLFSMRGRHFDLANPIDFWRFPMSLADKAHFVRLMLGAFAKTDWSDYEGRSAADLLDERATPGVREALFEPLTQLKFGLSCAEVSGAWLGARLSFREGSAPLGYIPDTNWTTVLCAGIERLLKKQGVRLRVSSRVTRLRTEGRRVVAAELEGGECVSGDVFVSALPTPTHLDLVPNDDAPALREIRYSALLSTVCATEHCPREDFYWMNLASLDRTACGIFVLSSLNPTLGARGQGCVNFVTHLNAPQGLFELTDAELLERYQKDYRMLFGVELRPLWSHVARVRMYSPIFTPSYRNPPVRSPSYDNLFLTGNYRTHPSIMSTGTALGSGVHTGEEILSCLGGTSDLGARIRAFRPPTMQRALARGSDARGSAVRDPRG
jgi:protoporphyrinogen oxidase